jgi:hypothetical protein
VTGDHAGPTVKPRSISAVLPAYNEVAVIADVARRTHTALVSAGLSSFEVIVVDDGSDDGTGDAVRSLQRELPQVRVVAHGSNRGYGAALRSGFEAATSEAVWLLDADGQFDPADLSRLLSVYAPDRLVTGYRAQRRDGATRRLYHAAFFGLAGVLVGNSVRDANCAFKLFPRPAGLGLQASGAMLPTELLLRARRLGYDIAEVPIPHHPRTAGAPTGARPAVVARAFVELWRLWRRELEARSQPGEVLVKSEQPPAEKRGVAVRAGRPSAEPAASGEAGMVRDQEPTSTPR